MNKLESPSNPVTSLDFNSPIVIDGRWLLHQITSFTGCETYRDVAREYLKLPLPKYAQRKVVVVFDGYTRSTKDHEH